MAKLTNCTVKNSHDDLIAAHPFGNNIAFGCQFCWHPVLATDYDNFPGSDNEHPAICRGCGRGYYLDVISDTLLYIKISHICR